MINIGLKIKQLRLNKNLTLRQLGELSNLSHSFIADIESNRTMPSIKTLVTLCDILEISLSDFFKE